MVAVALGDVARAADMLHEVIAIIRETGSRQLAQSLLDVAAGVAAVQRDWPRVAAWFGAAEAQMRETGLQRDAADAAALLPHVERARAALGEAAFDAAAAGSRRGVEAVQRDAAGEGRRDGQREALARHDGGAARGAARDGGPRRRLRSRVVDASVNSVFSDAIRAAPPLPAREALC